MHSVCSEILLDKCYLMSDCVDRAVLDVRLYKYLCLMSDCTDTCA